MKQGQNQVCPSCVKRRYNFCIGGTSRLMHKQPVSSMIDVLDGPAHYQSKFQDVFLQTIPTTLLREAFVHKQCPWSGDIKSNVGLLGSLVDFTIYQMIKTHLVCHYQQHLWHQGNKPICCDARCANVTVSRWLLGRSSWPNNHSHPFPLRRPYKA